MSYLFSPSKKKKEKKILNKTQRIPEIKTKEKHPKHQTQKHYISILSYELNVILEATRPRGHILGHFFLFFFYLIEVTQAEKQNPNEKHLQCGYNMSWTRSGSVLYGLIKNT